MLINPGTVQRLPIFEITDKGYLLGTADDNILLPKRNIRGKHEVGAEIDVFSFYDEEKEIELTAQLPDVQVGQVGCFRILNSNDLGAFINIGLRRDVLIPKKEINDSAEEGKMALVILCDDPVNGRLFASTRIGRYLNNEEVTYQRGDEVSLVIAEKIDIGRRVVIDGKFTGALFEQEMTDRVRLGEKVKGYVRRVEGKDITVSMQREGMELLEDSKAKLLAYLEVNGGYVRLNDDTNPEEIKLRLHMSKKAFKKAAGMLYKDGKVILTKFGVKLTRDGVAPEGWDPEKFDDSDEKSIAKLDAAAAEKKRLIAFKEKAPEDKKGWKVKTPAFMTSKRERISVDKKEEGREKKEEKKVFVEKKEIPLRRNTEEHPDEEPIIKKKEAAPKREAPRYEEEEEAPAPKPKKELTFKGKK